MHTQPEVALRLEEHLLADGLHAHGLAPVEHGGALGETSLRAGGAHRLADEVAIELPRDAVDGMSFGHVRPGVREERAVALEVGDLSDAPDVPLVAGERRGDEPVDERRDLVVGVLTRADGDDVRVVVLPRELGRGEVPDERRADPGDLVRGDLLAVARAAEDDTERRHPCRLIDDDGLRRPDAEGRVVVERVVLHRTVVDHLVPRGAEMLLQPRRELESGVIGGDVDAHGLHPRIRCPGLRGDAGRRGLEPRAHVLAAPGTADVERAGQIGDVRTLRVRATLQALLDEIDDALHERLADAGRRRADEGEARLLRGLGGLGVEIPEDLHVVAHEADGDHDDRLTTAHRELRDHVADIGLQPGLRRGARTGLVDELPGHIGGSRDGRPHLLHRPPDTARCCAA